MTFDNVFLILNYFLAIESDFTRYFVKIFAVAFQQFFNLRNFVFNVDFASKKLVVGSKQFQILCTEGI